MPIIEVDHLQKRKLDWVSPDLVRARDPESISDA